jgi:hypothetical protein
VTGGASRHEAKEAGADAAGRVRSRTPGPGGVVRGERAPRLTFRCRLATRDRAARRRGARFGDARRERPTARRPAGPPSGPRARAGPAAARAPRREGGNSRRLSRRRGAPVEVPSRGWPSASVEPGGTLADDPASESGPGRLERRGCRSTLSRTDGALPMVFCARDGEGVNFVRARIRRLGRTPTSVPEAFSPRGARAPWPPVPPPREARG